MDWRFLYRGLKARYRDERCEISALLAGLRPDDVAVDIGAHKGSYMWSLARAVPRGHVYAFEPQPLMADYLRQVCAAGRLRNVTVVEAAVSDHAARSVLRVPGEREISHGASLETSVDGREIEVEVMRLDDYLADPPGRVGAIKIDVEGHERAVILGACDVIEEHRPVIVLECETRHLHGCTTGDVFDALLAMDYSGTFCSCGREHALSDFDPVIHQAPVGERFWDAPGYVNNFVFRPSRGGAD